MFNHIFRKFIKSPRDLITPRSKIVEGFINQARQKFENAERYVEDAKKALERLSHCNTIDDIIADSKLKSVVLFSVGLSEKAQSHLSDEDLAEIVKIYLEIIKKGSDDLGSEILYRYLLTTGDSLGGTMRNITGASAQELISSEAISWLESSGIKYTIIKSNKGKVQIVSWNERILLFDKKPNFIGNNVDVILVKGTYSKGNLNIIKESKEQYIAVGELKGGIDPAGADEHWKTARSALERIKRKFRGSSNKPKLFFAGAAIEQTMAREIYKSVRTGYLDFAANLSIDEQVDALVSWLFSI